MNDLNNIPKKDIFRVPDNYFDKLASKIQERVAENPAVEKVFYLKPAFQFAFAGFLLILVSSIIFFRSSDSTTDNLFADIPEGQIIDFLQESDIQTLEIIEVSNLSDVKIYVPEKQQLNLNKDMLEEELLNDDIEDFI